MPELFIIGNGFDLAHGLPTSYLDFHDWLDIKTPDFERDLSDTYGGELWSNLEEQLAYPDVQHIENEICQSYENSFGSLTEDDGTLTYNAEETIESVLPYQSFRCDLLDKVKRWAQCIDADELCSVKKAVDLPADSLYFTFNYTMTLERVYHIPESRICHIHGMVEGADPVVLGHATVSLPLDQPEATNYNEIDEELKAKGEPYDAERITEISNARRMRNQAAATVDKLIRSTVKDSESCWADAEQFVNILKKERPGMIKVIGHSYADVDQLYFDMINQMVPGERWMAYWYKPEEKIQAEKIFDSCGITNYILLNSNQFWA